MEEEGKNLLCSWDIASPQEIQLWKSFKSNDFNLGFHTLVTVNANRIPRQNLCWYSRVPSQGKAGSCSEMGKKKKSENLPSQTVIAKCVFLMLSRVFKKTQFPRVHYFLFESICLPCLLLSDKGGREHLLLFTENPSQDLPSFIHLLWNILCLLNQ